MRWKAENNSFPAPLLTHISKLNAAAAQATKVDAETPGSSEPTDFDFGMCNELLRQQMDKMNEPAAATPMDSALHSLSNTSKAMSKGMEKLAESVSSTAIMQKQQHADSQLFQSQMVGQFAAMQKAQSEQTLALIAALTKK